MADDYSFELEDGTFDEIRMRLSGNIDMDSAGALRKSMLETVGQEPLKNLVVDLEGVNYMDSAGAAVLMELHRKCLELRNTLRLINASATTQGLLDLVDFEHCKDRCSLGERPQPSLVTQIGDSTVDLSRNCVEMITFVGEGVWAFIRDLTAPRKIKWEPFAKLLERSGVDAVPIVVMLSFLMGAILAFQAAIQLRKFGANIFVADLVSVSICLEMGPLLTALIVAGRSGAAYAANIGTMQVTEEIDALRVMGLDPIRYLAVPRIIAVAVALPLLTVFADVMGILGGCVVSAASLDLTPMTYLNQVREVLEVSDVLKGLTKSFVFGVEIALIGCMRGFQVRGGAEGVGAATTSSVVTSIFVLTVTDAIFAMLFYYMRFL